MPVSIEVFYPAVGSSNFTAVGEALDWVALGKEWRCLEALADCSFFQSWTWLGCRAEIRFIEPVLLRASRAGRVVGLALFNRTTTWLGSTLRLSETGRPGEDSVFIEHNGPLLARGHEDVLLPIMAMAARQGRLILSGVDDRVLRAVQALAGGVPGRYHISNEAAAPHANLVGLDPGDGYLRSLGASTRYRLRRSRRLYESSGLADSSLGIQAAESVEEALVFLDAMAVLHQERWRSRDMPGAFAEPAFLAFHQALVERAVPRGEIELLKISVFGPDGPRVIGYLYNFRWRQTVYAYQSGFNFDTRTSHQTPGLTCHHLAIERAVGFGHLTYDFLAGHSQYKTSLGHSTCTLYWLRLTRASTGYDILQRLRAGLKTIRRDRRLLIKDAKQPDGNDTASPPANGARTAASSRRSRRLSWPLAVVCICVLSLLAWVELIYVIHWFSVGRSTGPASLTGG